MATELNPVFTLLIANKENWPKFQALLDTAARIVGAFDEHGEVLQSNDAGMYDETTDIEKLRGAVVSIDPDMVPHGDYLPWLTEEQQKRLIEVAVEVHGAGNGSDNFVQMIDRPLMAESDVETMTPRERLEATGYPDASEDRKARLRGRLGFNPDPE